MHLSPTSKLGYLSFNSVSCFGLAGLTLGVRWDFARYSTLPSGPDDPAYCYRTPCTPPDLGYTGCWLHLEE